MKVVLFGNIFIDNEMRFQRMKDSLSSFVNEINFERIIINIRGSKSEEALNFIESAFSNKSILRLYSINSEKGWIHDSLAILESIDEDLKGRYVHIFLEDHLCLNPKSYDSLIREMSEERIDYLMYSWFQGGIYNARFKKIEKVKKNNIEVFVHTRENNQLIDNKSYILSLAGIFLFDFFLTILKGSHSNNWPINTPFNFEKSHGETHVLPFRRALLQDELFACIDDDLGVEGSSLASRGLYLNDSSRQSYAQKEIKERLVEVVKKIRSLFYKFFSSHLRFLILWIQTPYVFKKDYFLSLRDDYKGNYLPWLNYSSILFLEKFVLKNNQKLFEYGSGSSTRYFLEKGLSVTSVEHDELFFNSEISELHIPIPQVRSNQIPKGYKSDLYSGYSFQNYVESIRGCYDIIIVDGRARIGCLEKAINHLNPGGWIIFDNSNRNRYKLMEVEALNSFEKFVFKGTVRGLLHKEETTFYKKL